jgi:hypothetical protein
MNITKSIFILLIAAIAIASCESDEQGAQPTGSEALSQSAQDFLVLKRATSSINSLSTNISNPSAKSFIRSSAGRVRSDSTGDTTVNETCAEIKAKYNQDGSMTTTFDYGDGCQVSGAPRFEFLYGQLEATFNYWSTFFGTTTRNHFYYQSKFKNFGGRYTENGQVFEWSNNGTTTDQSYSDTDSVTGSYSGQFQHDAHITMVWNGQTYEHKGSSTTSYDMTGMVVEESDFIYSTNNDGFYHTKVVEPLVMKFNCQADSSGMSPIIYVSGIESVHFKDSNGEGSFEIHYGNGECDQIVTIVEKGKRKKVNL